MNERDSIPPAEKLAQFEDSALPAKIRHEHEELKTELAGLKRLIEIGLGDPDMGPVPVGSWATEDQDEWAERREAFSNEGEVEP